MTVLKSTHKKGLSKRGRGIFDTNITKAFGYKVFQLPEICTKLITYKAGSAVAAVMINRLMYLNGQIQTNRYVGHTNAAITALHNHYCVLIFDL